MEGGNARKFRANSQDYDRATEQRSELNAGNSAEYPGSASCELLRMRQFAFVNPIVFHLAIKNEEKGELAGEQVSSEGFDSASSLRCRNTIPNIEAQLINT
ncbi:unnamed protein product [Heligmosomoides polygyrus]|uniref:Uncharacterized protein n=1 Tax=Heligmosomoides polygyrus TaxID=6339 RepID=A0A183FHD0_HELPZ|nr:unnamed protein product [Heligmosomoides polygyrus]